MNLLPAGDLFQFITHGKVTATGGSVRNVVNSWWYLADHLSTGGNLPGPTSCAAFIATVWSGVLHLNDRLHPNYVSQPLVQIAYEANSVWTHTDVTPPSGASGGVSEPVTTAVCITLRCASRGRPYVGRKMLGPISQNDVSGDELTPGVHANWQSIANQFLTPLSALFGGVTWHFTPVIVSQLYSNLGVGSAGAVGDFLTVAHANSTVSSWRHRRERTVR